MTPSHSIAVARMRAEVPVAAELAGTSDTICRIRELLLRAAARPGGVLLTADRGVDVDAVARALHGRSGRAQGPFVAVDCAGADAHDLDTRLFGDAPPASDFEAVAAASAVAAAGGGTLFLRAIADLPAGVQARLARIARDGEVRVDGAIVPLDVRIVAGATPSIDADVDANRVRSDLYRRVSTCRIDLPSLDDRADDLPAMAVRVLDDFCLARRLPPRRFTDAALSLFAALAWPGNIAELRSVIERALGNAGDEDLRTEHVLPALGLHRARVAFTPSGNLRDARLRFERDYISAVLQHHGWRMADAALTLGIQRPNLYRKARQLGIPLTRVPE